MRRALAVGIAFAAFAAGSASAQAVPSSLSIDEAVAAALAGDPGVISARLDALSSKAKADQAAWSRYPSLSASASLQYLGEQSATSLALGPMTVEMPAGLNHSVNLGLSLQYPVFTGFRVRESIAIAALQAQGKALAQEQAKRALAFDARRAYWEAVRATYNVGTLRKSLELAGKSAELATRQLGQGVATRADQLAAQMRLEQATEDLGDARSLQKRAFLALASLAGMDVSSLGIATAAQDGAPPFELSTEPDATALSDAPLSEASLVSEALARRPETRTAELARKLSEHAIALSRAALYPTVAIVGSGSLADPNPRALVQEEKFSASGSIGLSVTYNVGAIPAALEDIKAQTLGSQKAASDERRQRNAIVMDVLNCIVALERTRRDLASTEAMVEQARENLRVVQGRVAAGTAKEFDRSASEFDLTRMLFAVTNRRIDALIAQADLERATASEELE
jgi:outer membrane protein TolC